MEKVAHKNKAFSLCVKSLPSSRNKAINAKCTLMVSRCPKHKSIMGHKHFHASACRIILGECLILVVSEKYLLVCDVHVFSVGLIMFNLHCLHGFRPSSVVHIPKFPGQKALKHSRAAEAHGAADHHRLVCLPGSWHDSRCHKKLCPENP